MAPRVSSLQILSVRFPYNSLETMWLPKTSFWRGLSGTNSGGPFAPGRFLFTPEKWFEKREKRFDKRSETCPNNLSPSQAAWKDFTGTSLKVFHRPELAKINSFSPRGCAGFFWFSQERPFSRNSKKTGWPRFGSFTVWVWKGSGSSSFRFGRFLWGKCYLGISVP